MAPSKHWAGSSSSHPLSAPFSVASEKTNWDQISWITASCRSLSKCSEVYLERAWFFFSLLYCAYLGLFQNLSSRRKKNICSLIFSLAIFRSLGLSGPFSAAPFYSMDVFVKNSLCLVRVIILASTSPLTGKNVCFSCHFVTVWLLPLQKWKDTLAQDPFSPSRQDTTHVRAYNLNKWPREVWNLSPLISLLRTTAEFLMKLKANP